MFADPKGLAESIGLSMASEGTIDLEIWHTRWSEREEHLVNLWIPSFYEIIWTKKKTECKQIIKKSHKMKKKHFSITFVTYFHTQVSFSFRQIKVDLNEFDFYSLSFVSMNSKGKTRWRQSILVYLFKKVNSKKMKQLLLFIVAYVWSPKPAPNNGRRQAFNHWNPDSETTF